MFDEIDQAPTINNLLTPSISNTISRAEPSRQYTSFLVDLFPNPNPDSGFTSVKPTFKVDDEIVFFYFDEIVSAGRGNIVISSDTDKRLIDVNDTSQVEFGAPDYNSHNPYFQNREEFGVVTINLSRDLMLDTIYTIQLGDGVFLDRLGNPQAGFNNASFKTIPSSPNLYSSVLYYIPNDENLSFILMKQLNPG